MPLYFGVVCIMYLVWVAEVEPLIPSGLGKWFTGKDGWGLPQIIKDLTVIIRLEMSQALTRA